MTVQLSEISIPHFLTASIFTAQSGNVAVFHRNVRLLILLCVISGICRSRSCMVKGSLILQVSHFDGFFFHFLYISRINIIECY